MKILHLYHDIMNLYGDYANITAMKKLAEYNGGEVVVDRLTIGDAVTFADYDFIYIGSGTERNRAVVLEDLRRLKPQIDACIANGKVILMTGNAFENLGRTITDCTGKVTEGLGIFDFDVKEQDKTRLVGDAVFDCAFLDSPAVGFINKCSAITGVDEPLFTVQMGPGNAEDDKAEGVRRSSLFGTHLTGPVLVKNPHLLTYLYELILGEKPDDACLSYEKKGYAVTLQALQKRIENGQG